MSTAESELLYSNIISAYSIAQRLAWSQQRLSGLFPMTAENLSTLDAESEERVDAWLHRFNSLASLRNKLSHQYPDDPTKQADRLNHA